MIDVIKENWTMILTLGFMFLVGVGVGGAITDAIRGMKDERDNKTQHDRISAAQTVRKVFAVSERKRGSYSRSGKENERQAWEKRR